MAWRDVVAACTATSSREVVLDDATGLFLAGPVSLTPCVFFAAWSNPWEPNPWEPTGSPPRTTFKNPTGWKPPYFRALNKKMMEETDEDYAHIDLHPPDDEERGEGVEVGGGV